MSKLEDTLWWFVAKRIFISQVFPRGSEFKILDIGAGTGGTTKFLKKYGEVVGIEPNQEARKLASKNGIKLISGHAEKLPLKGGSFKIITLFDVLYHKKVLDDLRALKEAYRILEPKGYLVITDSALEILRGPHDEALYARERYTKKELIKKVKAAGFRVEKASYIFFFLFPLILAKRLFDKLKSKIIKSKAESDVSRVPKLINQVFIKICAFEAYLLRNINFPWGSSIIIRAIKS